jgi:hypothetical protein
MSWLEKNEMYYDPEHDQKKTRTEAITAQDKNKNELGSP